MSGLFGEHCQCVNKALWPYGLVWDMFVVDEKVCHVPGAHYRAEPNHHPTETERYEITTV